MEVLEATRVARGTSQRGLLTPDLGHPVRIPYVVVRGRRPGPTLLVTAGVHGAEYASIEAAYRVAATDAERLRGDLIVLPIVNVPSFFARSIYVNPVDGENLNRVFPGRPDGSFAHRLAAWLTRTFVRHADAYLDLHGGDMIESLVPFSIHARGHRSSQELADAFGLPYRIASDGSGTSYAAGAAAGVPTVLAESGGQGRWPEAAIQPLTEGVQRVLIHLGMVDGELQPAPDRALEAFEWLRSEADGLWYPSATAGDAVVRGQEVGVVTDLLGEVVQRAVASVPGVVLFAVESLAINRGDPLVGVGGS